MRAPLEWKDIAGNDIIPGSYIVYAALWSRSATLKYGIVTRLTRRSEGYGDNSKTIPTIRVISVDRSAYKHNWSLQKNGGEVSLSFLDRLLCVNPFQSVVPTEVFNLLFRAYEQFMPPKDE